MNIQQDFEELLKLLEEHKVEYLIVGGVALQREVDRSIV
jgi:hypothetical protein